MNALKVSVIVPFYNAEASIGRTLESIAVSSHEHIEVILIDDCSSDRSGDIAAALLCKDGRFKCFRNAENRNVSFCRNRGIDAASGDFILFVDSDDRISPDWIRNLLNDAVATGAEVVIGKTRRLEGGRERDYRMKGLGRCGSLRFETMVFKDNSVVWNKLYSSALIKREGIRFDEGLCIGEDLLFNFQALGLARGIYYNDKGYYCYQADNKFSIMRSSPPAKRISNLSRLLRILVERSMNMEKKNRGVLSKVSRDILMLHYRFKNEAIDRSTMNAIREIDCFMPFKVRFSLFRKSVRGAIFLQARA